MRAARHAPLTGGATPQGRIATRNANALRGALATQAVRQTLHSPGALHNPVARAAVTASLATAAWHHGNTQGWWRHRHGGYGWVGPLFWPFAYNDFYNYALWGDDSDPSFWDYGYSDIYAGLFSPYGYNELSGYAEYLPNRPTGGIGQTGGDAGERRNPLPTPDKQGDQASLTQMCGDDSRDVAGLPVDTFASAIAPDDAQRAALDDLAAASQKAAQSIRTACPADIALTAPNRLAAMQIRLEAMLAAVQTVQPPLEKFYALLNDEQKAKLTALAADQHAAQVAPALPAQTAQTCGASQPGITDWPGALIEQTVKPTGAQRQNLTALQNATNTASETLKASCEPAKAVTPPARLAAVSQRLETMVQAIRTIRPALDTFYGSLNDEQKANFDAIGQQRMSIASASSDDDDDAPRPATHRRVRRSGHVGVERMIRHMMSFIR